MNRVGLHLLNMLFCTVVYSGDVSTAVVVYCISFPYSGGVDLVGP